MLISLVNCARYQSFFSVPSRLRCLAVRLKATVFSRVGQVELRNPWKFVHGFEKDNGHAGDEMLEALKISVLAAHSHSGVEIQTRAIWQCIWRGLGVSAAVSLKTRFPKASLTMTGPASCETNRITVQVAEAIAAGVLKLSR